MLGSCLYNYVLRVILSFSLTLPLSLHAHLLIPLANAVNESKTDQFLGGSMASNGERFIVSNVYKIM